MIIAIAGAAASGKGTLAKMLAWELKLPHYDFGLMFRAIALFRSNLHAIQVRDGKILLNNSDITDMLRTEEVGLAAAQLASKHPEFMACTAMDMVIHSSFICDGRTCGTEIYPEADYKFFLCAKYEERVRRRVQDGGDTAILGERERLDEKRLRIADGAIIVHTDGKTKEQSLQELILYIRR